MIAAPRSPRRSRHLPAEGDGPQDPAQSLVDGDLARALFAVELATTSPEGSWDEVTDSLLAATRTRADRSARASLFYGAPAAGFVLDTTGAYRTRWAHQLASLDQDLVAVTMDRLAAVEARVEAGASPKDSEFNLVNGMSGLGFVLLRRVVHQPARNEDLERALAGVLTYLVDRAQDRVLGEVLLPGWWTPDRHHTTAPGAPVGVTGHADFGMALGGAGILALLAASYRAGRHVVGHGEAIDKIVGWYARWRQETPERVVWWPNRLSLEELRTGHVAPIGRDEPSPLDPTWAHGTPGIGRALQMAAIARKDQQARLAAENAIASCLIQSQLGPMNEPDLYGGTGGMYLTVLRAAEDAERFHPLSDSRIPPLLHRLSVAGSAVSRTSRVLPDPDDSEFLYGRFGTRLVFESLRRRASPVCGGDGVLGIGWAE
ncbi:lanthionine synthetase LanC family protein [Promicromonospora sp. NPDC090134]|uniref:lanthionine synthetase LanC family protein n=1 Tax=Promicromonospora sp. NPDC090134 TaxID=3364408 RepID=UPI0037F97BD8